jgi:SHS2 domain-containing protein
MQPGYTLFDHTADMGVRVGAATPAELLELAAQGLYAVIGELPAGSDERTIRFELAADEPAYLLHDYLTELLRVFEREQRVLSRLDVQVFDDHRLSADGRLARIDAQRCVLRREVKAVTYHELAIRPVEGGFEAVFIVDI